MGDNRGQRARRSASKAWLAVAIATVALVLVGGVAALWPGRTSSAAGGATKSPVAPLAPVTPAPSSSAARVTTQPATPDRCGSLTDRAATTPTTTPLDVTWNLWRGVAIPTSRSAGPAVVNAATGVTDCYSHTPLGALMAAANISYRIFGSAPDSIVADHQLAAGPGRPLLLSQVRAYQRPDSVAQLAAFRFVTYAPAVATVQLVNGTAADRSLRASALTVIWAGGTWQLLATPDGQIGSSPQPITDLSGYVPFSGMD